MVGYVVLIDKFPANTLHMETILPLNVHVMSTKRCYNIINLSFLTVILGVILYSLLFRGAGYPVPALLTELTGLIPPSKGLSASFSELVRGNIELAKTLNPYGMQIFGFFIIQLLMRVLFSAIAHVGLVKENHLILLDIILSTGLFALCFAPLIAYTFKLFAQLLG